ncbi:MAG: CpaF family protein, partial [bacterium]|nr:CpaF family protein [bacterium]
MSAFGRKNGPAGMKSGFGVARPMQGGSGKEEARGGDQFPPLDIAALPGEMPFDPLSVPTSQMQRNADAMSRLSDRANAEHLPDAGPQGFEASVHKI